MNRIERRGLSSLTRRRWIGWSVFLTLVSGIAAAQNSPFSGPASVSLSASPNSIAVGATSTVSVSVDLTGITGICNGAAATAVLGGYAIPLNFDRNRLEYLSAVACDSPQFSSTPTATNAASANASGTVSVASSQTSGTGPTGRVCVARLTFRAISGGSATITPGTGISLSSAFQTCPGGGSGGPSTITSTTSGTTINVTGGSTLTSIIPVAASTAGSGGSFFKTAFQIHNPTTVIMTGRVVYHPQGVAGGASDPSLQYSIPPSQTLYFADLLPAMGQSGLGSIDLIAESGQLPVSVARIFNDAGALGTTGMVEDQLLPENAIRAGERAVLIAPPNLVTARLNIGVRTLDAASFTVTVISKEGATVGTVAKNFAATYFEQRSSTDFLGLPLTGSESLRIQVNSGSVIIYGATTDNITQDPSLQLAKRIP